MNLRTFALFLLILVAARASQAQSGGSAYSLFGIGDLRYYPSVRSIGMGSTGLGLQSPFTINANSPASWARIAQTRLEAGLFYEGFNSTDGNLTRYLGGVGFSGAMLAIPISTARGITLVGGFTPFASADYIATSRQPYYSGTDSTSFLVKQVEDGRISQAQVGLSWAPVRNFTLGASFIYRFGKYTKTLEQEAGSTSYAGGTLTQETSLRGTAFSVGAQLESLGMLADALSPMSVGFVFTSGGPLKLSVDRLYQYAVEADTLPTFETSTRLPVSIGAGIGYQLSPRWVAAADVTYQPWTTLSIEGRPVSTLKDATRIGLGIERAGSRELSATWLDRCAYRFGGSYSSTYLELNGRAINEWSISAGATVPLSGENRIAFALEGGQRGSTASGYIKDTVVRFHVALLVSEIWFTRPEDE